MVICHSYVELPDVLFSRISTSNLQTLRASHLGLRHPQVQDAKYSVQGFVDCVTLSKSESLISRTTQMYSVAGILNCNTQLISSGVGTE